MYTKQNTLIVIALLTVIILLATQNIPEGLAPFKPRSRKPSQRPGKWFKILSSFFGQTRADDNGVGAGGVSLFSFPYKRRINDKFGTRMIYPVAMTTSDIKYYKYAILQIKNGSKTIFAQVVDECADGDCGENSRSAKKRGGKLVDIHKTAFSAIGASGSLRWMKARIIDRPSPRDSQMASVLNADGKRGYVQSHWK